MQRRRRRRRRVHDRQRRRLLRRPAGDELSRPRRPGAGHRRRRARRQGPHRDAVPGVLARDQRPGHGQGDARLGQHPGGLRRRAGEPGRRGRRRRRRRGRRAARRSRSRSPTPPRRARRTRPTSASSSPPACWASTCTRCASRWRRPASSTSTDEPAVAHLDPAPVAQLDERTHGLPDDPGLAAVPSRTRRSRASGCRRARWTRTATCSARAREFPYAPERKYTPCDASKDQLFALRDRLGLRAQRRSSRRPATAPTTARWSTRCGTPTAGRAASPRSRRDVTDAELAALHAAGVRGTRFNFVKRLVDFTPRDELLEIAQPHRAARLARRRLLRGGGPAGAVGLLHRAADAPSSSTTWGGPT